MSIKSNKEITLLKKKKNRKVILVIEGEFDITKMSELPDHIVHYCISFLSTEESPDYYCRNFPEKGYESHQVVLNFRDNRPSKWFDNLLRSETELLWNSKYVPELTKAFNKIPKEQIRQMTYLNEHLRYWPSIETKRDWIKKKLDFSYYKDDYRIKCIETILLSKGLSYPHYDDKKHSLYLNPYNPENFVAKLHFKEPKKIEKKCDPDAEETYSCQRCDLRFHKTSEACKGARIEKDEIYCGDCNRWFDEQDELSDDEEEGWHCCKCKKDFIESEVEHIDEVDDAVCKNCCIKYGFKK